ncbi:MAG: hypothetical protein AAF636_27670, partial [Pseudomonadota bacterium]
MEEKPKSQKSNGESADQADEDLTQNTKENDIHATESSEPDSEIDSEEVVETERLDNVSESEEVVEGTIELQGVEAEQQEKMPIISEDQPASGGFGFFPLILGGIAAGGIGFLTSTFFGPQAPEFDPSELLASIETNESEIQTLAGDVSSVRELTSIGPDFSTLETSLSSLEDELALLVDQMSAVQSRFTAIESAFSDEVAAIDARILALETAVPAATELSTDDELAALRARISEMTAMAQQELANVQAEAGEVSRAAEEARLAAEARAAELEAASLAREAEIAELASLQRQLTALRSAVEDGAEFSELLEGLEDVPDVLASNASQGIPTLQLLQQMFPNAARSAVSVSMRVSQDASAGEKLTAFLK